MQGVAAAKLHVTVSDVDMVDLRAASGTAAGSFGLVDRLLPRVFETLKVAGVATDVSLTWHNLPIAAPVEDSQDVAERPGRGAEGHVPWI